MEKKELVKYIINEENKVVVAVIDDCAMDLIDYLSNVIPNSEPVFQALMNLKKDSTLLLDSPYKGKAKCAPEDTFDLEYGKKLAARRAQEKYENAKLRLLKSIVENFTSKVQKEVEKQSEKFQKISLEREKVENLSK